LLLARLHNVFKGQNSNHQLIRTHAGPAQHALRGALIDQTITQFGLLNQEEFT